MITFNAHEAVNQAHVDNAAGELNLREGQRLKGHPPGGKQNNVNFLLSRYLCCHPDERAPAVSCVEMSPYLTRPDPPDPT